MRMVIIMLKRLFFALIICILLIPAVNARADVVWSNDFFNRNKDDTEPMNRSFIVNGADGYVSAKEAPGSDKEAFAYENGMMIIIGSTYLDHGRYWGIPPIGHAYNNMQGWFLMDEMLMIYDHIDFVAEHQEELYDYTGNANRVLRGDEYFVWRWPGSDMEKLCYSTEYVSNSDFKATYAYKDNEGREWAYFRIMGGGPQGGGLYAINAASGWICLDDADNGQIPAFNPAPDPIVWSGEETPDWYGGSGQQPNEGGGYTGNDDGDDAGNIALNIIIATMALISLTAVLFILLRGRNP